ncbi:hypothetical protein SNEBB_008975 [Seison nebaliae]|nr:hypothetical protein SNEBB_008975 [Seison nebaliae]
MLSILFFPLFLSFQFANNIHCSIFSHSTSPKKKLVIEHPTEIGQNVEIVQRSGNVGNEILSQPNIMPSLVNLIPRTPVKQSKEKEEFNKLFGRNYFFQCMSIEDTGPYFRNRTPRLITSHERNSDELNSIKNVLFGKSFHEHLRSRPNDLDEIDDPYHLDNRSSHYVLNRIKYSLHRFRVSNLERESFIALPRVGFDLSKEIFERTQWINDWDGIAEKTSGTTTIYFISYVPQMNEELVETNNYYYGFMAGEELHKRKLKFDSIFTGTSQENSQTAAAIAIGLSGNGEMEDGETYTKFKAYTKQVSYMYGTIFKNWKKPFHYLETSNLIVGNANQEKNKPNLEQFFQRYLYRSKNNQNHLIIAEGNAITYLILRLLQMPPTFSERFSLNCGSISSAIINGDGTTLIDSFNDLQHLLHM